MGQRNRNDMFPAFACCCKLKDSGKKQVLFTDVETRNVVKKLRTRLVEVDNRYFATKRK